MKAIVLKYYALLPTVLLSVFYAIKTIGFPLHDFSNYYFGGKFLAQGDFGQWIYFPYEFNQAIAQTGTPHIFASYAPNTPFLALVFAPFSLLQVGVAKLLFTVISIVLFMYSLKRLVRFYKIPALYLLLVPILFFIPIKNEILFGQVYFVLFFLLSESWIAYQKDNIKTSAFLLAFAILLKVFPLLLVCLFAFKRQFRYLAFLAGFGLLLLGVSMLFSGFEIWHFFVTVVLPKASNGEISEAYVPNYQSVFMFLKEMLLFEYTENNHALFNQPMLFPALVFAFKIQLIVVGFFITRNHKNPLLVWSYWILAMVLISPYGSTYTFIFMLFPYLGLLQSEVEPWKKVAGLLLIFAISNFPLAYFLKADFPLSYMRLFVLILLFVLLFSLLYRSVNLKIATAFTAAALILALYFHRNDGWNPQYLLRKDRPVLIYDYQIKNDELNYFYWDETGENRSSYSYDKINAQPLELKNNQIFHNGRHYTNDNSHKIKPMLIDNLHIVYLSDLDRGIGFYTLRKIDLR